MRVTVLKFLLCRPHPQSLRGPPSHGCCVCLRVFMDFPLGPHRRRCQVTRTTGVSQAAAGTMGLERGGSRAVPGVSTGCEIGAWWVSFGAQDRGGPADVDVTASQALKCGCSISSGREVKSGEAELPRKQALRGPLVSSNPSPHPPLENQKYLLAPKGLMITLKSPPSAQGLPGGQLGV